MLPKPQLGNGRKDARTFFNNFGIFWIRDKLAGLSPTDALASLKVKGLEQQNKLSERMNQVPFLKTKDKVTFVLGVFLVLTLQYLLLEAPSVFPLFYTALVFPLNIYRFFTYHKNNYHYFMLDFCYYMQVFTLFLIWFWPNDVVFFKLFFGLANGPLLWAIVMWKNRVVFHDLDKLTSLFIHIMPPLVSHVYRFLLVDDPTSMFASPNPDASLNGRDFFYMIFFYALWQFLYWIKVEVVDRQKLENDKTIVTSAKWLSEYQPHPIYLALKKRFPFIKPQGTLIATQLVYTGLTMTLIPFMYASALFHATILFIAFGFACWYGASFYFDTFTENYTKRLERMVDKVKNPEKYAKEKDLDVVGKYCPRRRSVAIFGVYFAVSLLTVFLAFRYTIWA